MATGQNCSYAASRRAPPAASQRDTVVGAAGAGLSMRKESKPEYLPVIGSELMRVREKERELKMKAGPSSLATAECKKMSRLILPTHAFVKQVFF